MIKLRERQKADREMRILTAAVHKFRADGYKRARIEDLAQAAGVSVGTVYNYYGTKGDILIAVVALEVEEVLTEGRAVVDDPPDDFFAAVLALTFCYYDHSLNYLTKEMWRRAMALAIEAPDTPNGRRYAALDVRLAEQVGELIARFQQRGKVPSEMDATALGRVTFHSINQLFIAFVTQDAMTLEELRDEVTALTHPLAHLMQCSTKR
jgi:AcrR family transcriptional regulator